MLGGHIRTHVIGGTILSVHFPSGICFMQEGKIDPMGAPNVAKSWALSGVDYPDCSFIVLLEAEPELSLQEGFP
jgi:hypothetical protein